MKDGGGEGDGDVVGELFVNGVFLFCGRDFARAVRNARTIEREIKTDIIAILLLWCVVSV